MAHEKIIGGDMDFIPKFIEITARRRASHTEAPAMNKKAYSSKEDADEILGKERDISQGTQQSPYSRLPTIIDRGVPHLHSARNDDLYWNSVLTEGDISQYGCEGAGVTHKERFSRTFRKIVRRTSSRNVNSEKGRCKAAVKASHRPHHTTRPNRPQKQNQHSKSMHRQPQHDKETKPLPATPPPRRYSTTPTSEYNLHPYAVTPATNFLPYNHSPTPTTPLTLQTPTPSIAFSTSYTTALPTDSPILIYGPPGHRRRVILPQPRTSSSSSSSDTLTHLPTSFLLSPTPSPPPTSNSDFELELKSTWNATLNSILDSGSVPPATVGEVRNRACSSGTVNGNRIQGEVWVNMLDVGVVPNFSWPVRSAIWFDSWGIEELRDRDEGFSDAC